MRVLILIPSLLRAGAEVQAVDLANGLALRGHCVHVCAFEQRVDQADRLHPSVVFHHVLRRGKCDLSLFRRVAHILDESEIDIVLAVLSISALVGAIACRRSTRQPPMVAAIHTTKSRDRREEVLTQLVDRRVYRNADALVFVCQAQRAYWQARFPELTDMSRVIYNGIDPDRFDRAALEVGGAEVRRQLKIPGSAFVFVCIAAFRPEKSHGLLFEAFRGVGGDPYLILAGDGPLRHQIEQQVIALDLSKRVRIIGNVPDIRPVVVASNASVLSSTAVETFSMAMLESMALGVPVIAPDIGGLAEAIEHRVNGLLFPIGDVPALRAHMQALVLQPDVATQFGTAAIGSIRRNFTLDRMVARYEAMLNATLISTKRK